MRMAGLDGKLVCDTCDKRNGQCGCGFVRMASWFLKCSFKRLGWSIKGLLEDNEIKESRMNLYLPLIGVDFK